LPNSAPIRIMSKTLRSPERGAIWKARAMAHCAQNAIGRHAVIRRPWNWIIAGARRQIAGDQVEQPWICRRRWGR